MTVPDVRVAVIGAGAMGGVFGAKLTAAGVDTTLVDVRRDHVRRLRERGLELRSDTHREVVPVSVTAEPTELPEGGHDVQVFLCKSFDTQAAAAGVAHALRPDGVAVTLQNGLGNYERLVERYGARRSVPGTTTVGAVQPDPGVCVMSPSTAEGRSVTHLGRVAGHAGRTVQEFAETLTANGLPAEVLEDPDEIIWTKLVMAATMAPLTALLRRSVKDVFDDPAGRDLWRDMFEEMLAVAHAEGIQLPVEELRHHCESTYGSVGHHTTSMAADVIAGRRTEIEALILEVVERGRARGVPTPVLATVGRSIRALERSYERSL